MARRVRRVPRVTEPKSLLLRKSMQGLYIGASMFLSVIVLGAVAYHHAGWTFSDAIYMVVITVFSVGYEEVQPITTIDLRILTMLIIVAGDASKVYFVGSLVQFITEGEIGKAMDEHRKSRDIDSITDHAIICGYGRIGQVLARELEAKEFPFLILDNNPERIALAHIERCVVFATVLPNDMVNVFITLTARNMQPTLRIIARAEDPATEKKLRQAGANEIILPAFAGGMQIAHSILEASLDSILQGSDGAKHLASDLKELGLEIVEHSVVANGVHDRKTVAQLMRGIESNCLVLAVRKSDGSMVQHPSGTYRLEATDTVVMLSHGRLV
jgi:voltage-gated potassium channel